MEKQQRQLQRTRRDAEKRQEEAPTSVVTDSEPIQVATDETQQQVGETSTIKQEPLIETVKGQNIEQEGRIQKEPEPPPRREIIQESLSPPASTLATSPVPIAVVSDVIKSALNGADLGVRVRTVELVNGRLSGGNNSVRVNFISESVGVTESKFIAICAVIYHLDRKTNTVDVIVGLAEDEQANLLAILQTNMSDVTAWMNNGISRAEWSSKITKKIL